MKQWWKQRTFWVSLAGVCSSVAAVAAAGASLQDPKRAAFTLAVGGAFAAAGAFLGNLGSILAREGAVADALRADTATTTAGKGEDDADTSDGDGDPPHGERALDGGRDGG